jgi:hypothetical protein
VEGIWKIVTLTGMAEEVTEKQSTHGKSEIALEESEICSRWESRSPMVEIVE